MVLIVNAACAPGQAMQRENYLSGEKPAANQEAYTFGDDADNRTSGRSVAANNSYGSQDSYNRYDQPQRQGYRDNSDVYDDRYDNRGTGAEPARRDGQRVSASGGS